jgi:hypothetical protein
MDKIGTESFESNLGRAMSYHFGNFRDLVVISQRSDLVNLIVKSPTIHWKTVKCILPQDADTIELFRQCLDMAIAQAGIWDKDTDKNIKDVFGE